jgi:transcriptional regulator with XRE-family HTH domain
VQLGKRLREARQASGLKLKVVAERADTSETTLSLLERGQRSVSTELLERIVLITGADSAEVFRLADRVPPQAAADLLGADVAGVIDAGGLTADGRRALRRVRLQSLAVDAAGGVAPPPVDVPGVLDVTFGIQIRAVDDGVDWGHFAGAELVEYPEHLDAPGTVSQRNLILGHMAGHAILAAESNRRPACNHVAGGALEAEATWLAGLLLMPRGLLESEAQILAGTYVVGERSDFNNFVAEVAETFAVPDWMAAAHLADAGLLAWAAGEEAA